MLQDEWRSYQRTLPESAGPEQLDETRLAFYAGARAAVTLMRNRAGQHVSANGTALERELDEFLVAFRTRHRL